MRVYYSIKFKVYHLIVLIFGSFILGLVLGLFSITNLDSNTKKDSVLAADTERKSYWFLLHRKSNIEFLYQGIAFDKSKSKLIRKFKVKAGVPGQKPTPLPHYLGRDYWTIIAKMDSSSDPATAPYFLTLDIPVTDQEPYGPSNYPECKGSCNWELTGYFGLHGVNGDTSKLSEENEGSSGCIRHSDEDITYLYNLLDPTKEEIRYYIEDI